MLLHGYSFASSGFPHARGFDLYLQPSLPRDRPGSAQDNDMALDVLGRSCPFNCSEGKTESFRVPLRERFSEKAKGAHGSRQDVRHVWALWSGEIESSQGVASRTRGERTQVGVMTWPEFSNRFSAAQSGFLRRSRLSRLSRLPIVKVLVDLPTLALCLPGVW